MSTATASRDLAPAEAPGTSRALPAWWPLAALTLLAAALRFSTLDLQSFWYDEAFTPVRVLHPSLWATLRSVVHTENTPPLWYVIAWADARVFGTSELALRWPSALAGTLTVPVAWAIGRELTGRRATAIATAALVAVNPLLVWYSQEARAYGLFVFTASLAMLCFLRARARPTTARLAAFAATGALALLTHYFAVFELIPMAAILLWDLARAGPAATKRSASQAGGPEPDEPSGDAGGGVRTRGSPAAVIGAVAALGAVGLALLPLISAQGGHGTQWIGRWALSSRLMTIPQYYLTGYTGSSLGHGIELLVALAILAGVGFGLWRVLDAREERAAAVTLAIAACAVLIPIVLAFLGADYLAPRNLVAAMVPVTALIAVIVVSRRAGRVGALLCWLIALAFLAISIDVDLSPRLQRGDWRDLAHVLARPAPGGGAQRAITTVELGALPLRYYLPALHAVARSSSVTVSEIDETGYAPLRASAGRPPAPGFRLVAHSNVHGLVAYRFISSVARTISAALLAREVITLAHPEVLVLAAPGGGEDATRPSPIVKNP